MSPDHSVCSTIGISPVYLSCVINHPCDNIRLAVRWYRSFTEIDADEDVIRDNGQYINSSSSNGKHNVITHIQNGTVSNGIFDHCCFTNIILVINNFNRSDNGHYWCEFVANNRLLLPSSYGYIALSEGAAVNNRACTVGDFIHSLDPAQCAENTRTSHSGRMTCNSHTTTTTVANSDSTQSRSSTVTEITEGYESENYVSGTVQEEATTDSVPTNYTSESSTTSHSTTPKENNLLLYGAIAGTFVCFSIVLLLVVMCFVIAIYKYRKLEKKSK